MAAAIAWIKDVGTTYLDFIPDDFDAMMLRGGADVDGGAVEAFVGSSKAGTALYLYTTVIEEEAEVPVKYTREVVVAAPDPAPVPASPGADEALASETKHSESKEEIALAHATDGEPRTELIEETVMELHRIVRHVVSASRTPVPRSVAVLAVYFVKSRDGPLAGPGAGAEETFDDYMSEAVEYGSVNGDLLSSMVRPPPPLSALLALPTHPRAPPRRSSSSARSTCPSWTRCWAASCWGAWAAWARGATTRPCPTGTATAAPSSLESCRAAAGPVGAAPPAATLAAARA